MLLSPIFKLIGGGMVFVILMLGLALHMERRHSTKLQRQLIAATAELRRISDERNEQRAETGRNIGSAKERIVYVDRIIRPLESRPIADNPKCLTPNVDEWKDVL